MLAERSWHTAKTSNVEQVWIAEEAAKKESAKIAELQKQRKEEREYEEMLRMTGREDEAKASSMNWMYQGGIKTKVSVRVCGGGGRHATDVFAGEDMNRTRYCGRRKIAKKK